MQTEKDENIGDFYDRREDIFRYHSGVNEGVSVKAAFSSRSVRGVKPETGSLIQKWKLEWEIAPVPELKTPVRSSRGI